MLGQQKGYKFVNLADPFDDERKHEKTYQNKLEPILAAEDIDLTTFQELLKKQRNNLTTEKEKVIIANNYLLPKIREQVKFSNEDIIIPDNVINYIIENFCKSNDNMGPNEVEQGVRNLKRCLEIIHTRLNLYRLMKPGSNLFEREMSLQVEFPYTVTKDIVDKLIKKDKDLLSTALYSMYV